MDLLNNSSNAPVMISKVNNLITSPKGLILKGIELDGAEADNENSPTCSLHKYNDDSPDKIQIRRLNSANESEEEVSAGGEREDEDEDEEEEVENFTTRLKRSQFKHIDLPPPLELIAKSAFKDDEPIKTGAPIAFVSLAHLVGGRYKAEEKCGKTRAEMQLAKEEPK